MKFKGFHQKILKHLSRDKSSLSVYIIIRTMVIFVMIRAAFRQEFESVFVCLLSLILLMMPAIIERTLKIDLPTTLEIIIMVFIFAAEILESAYEDIPLDVSADEIRSNFNEIYAEWLTGEI